MNKAFILSILLFLFTLTGCSKENIVTQKDHEKETIINETESSKSSIPDFRDVSWGMSMSDVEKSEKEAKLLQRTNNSLEYDTSIDSLIFTLHYDFVDNKLFSADYFRGAKLVTDNEKYISDYEKFKNILTNKYGNPTVDKVIWKNDLLKGDPDQYSAAVALGYLVYAVQWITPKSEVSILLSGDNFRSSLLISYSSNEFKKLAEEKRVKDLKEKL